MPLIKIKLYYFYRLFAVYLMIIYHDAIIYNIFYLLKHCCLAIDTCCVTIKTCVPHGNSDRR